MYNAHKVERDTEMHRQVEVAAKLRWLYYSEGWMSPIFHCKIDLFDECRNCHLWNFLLVCDRWAPMMHYPHSEIDICSAFEKMLDDRDKV